MGGRCQEPHADDPRRGSGPLTADDRLRTALEALEESAPSDSPPNPARSRRPASSRLAAIGGVAIAGSLVAIGAVNLMDHRRSGIDVTSLEWSVAKFADSGVFDSITVQNGKIFVAGADADGPAIWISEDGFGWRPASVTTASRANQHAEFLSMGFVTGHGQELIALGHRLVTEGATTFWQSALWTSHDGGERWVDAGETSLPQGTLDVAAVKEGYVALGQGPNGVPDVWTSRDGRSWRLATNDATFGAATVQRMAVHDGLLVAVGADLGETGPSTAMAWRSTDGVDWEQIVLSRAGSVASDITAADSGFTAVGSEGGAANDAVAWQSSDGRTWQQIVLSRGTDYGAAFVGATDDSFIAISGGSWQRGRCPSQEWSVLSSWSLPAISLKFDGQVIGIVGIGDRYIGIGASGCGSLGDSSLSLIFGVPPGANHNVRLGESPR